MARYAASTSQGLQGRPILLRHQLAYGGGNLLGAARWRSAAPGYFISTPRSAD